MRPGSAAGRNSGRVMGNPIFRGARMALTELIKEMEQRILDSRDSNRGEATDHTGDEEDTGEAVSGTAAEDGGAFFQ